jgi:septum site-determining protein MinC
MGVFSIDRPETDGAVATVTRSHAAFDLKGVMSSMTVLRLRSRDLNLIERQLRAKVTQFPQFFQDAPVVLDLAELEGGLAGFPLAAVVRALSVCKVVPVAVANIEEAYRPVALAAGLGIVSLNAARAMGDATPAPPRASTAHPAEGGTTPAPAPQGGPVPQGPPPGVGLPHRAPMVIREPVRSGQLIYAEKSDLIVVAPVNPGAQLVADGNIHVYGPLRGRALAGASGDTSARIFCSRLEAELVSIAGRYLVSEQLPVEHQGGPAQIALVDDALTITRS